MELSPIKMVSVKLEIVVQEWRKRLFLFALLTRLGCQWSDLQREPQQHNLPSIFYQNEDVNFLSSVLSSQLMLVLLLLGMVSVDCVHCSSSECRTHDAWRKVTWLYVLLFFHKFFIACFVVVLNVHVAKDLRHEYAQFAWGFPFRGPPGSWLRSSCLHRGNWHSFDNDCHCGMSVVMILTMSSWRLCCVCWQGRLVASRLIATALLVTLEGHSSRERKMVWLFSGWASRICVRYNWLLCARFLHIFSRSTWVEAVITVRYHVKVMKTTKELDY
jgi:hypothetical protein